MTAFRVAVHQAVVEALARLLRAVDLERARRVDEELAAAREHAARVLERDA